MFKHYCFKRKRIMADYLLPEVSKAILNEALLFLKWVSRPMIIDIDADKIKFPEEFLQEAGRSYLKAAGNRTHEAAGVLT